MKVNLDHIAIILVEPQISENIGAAARAMTNMGLSRLGIVNPKNCDLGRVVKMATGSSIDVIEEMQIYGDLKEALRPFQYVVGTTARTGALRPANVQPRRLAVDLISITQHNLVALLFGREDCGLSNAHLRYCHAIVRIPTADFTSVNLAQAVMILSYEIFLASQETPAQSLPRLANGFELEGMYDHLKDILTKIGFIDQNNPGHWMLNIRRFLSRLPLRAREVRIIRGICRQIDWYTRQKEGIGTNNGGSAKR